VPHLVVPYTLDTNDMRFATMQGFNAGTQFFDYLKDAFDTLYREGDPAGLNAPKMLSIGLHARLIGRPARIAALERFLDYVLAHERVWIARRIDIARHWQAVHPYRPADTAESVMTRLCILSAQTRYGADARVDLIRPCASSRCGQDEAAHHLPAARLQIRVSSTGGGR